MGEPLYVGGRTFSSVLPALSDGGVIKPDQLFPTLWIGSPEWKVNIPAHMQRLWKVQSLLQASATKHDSALLCTLEKTLKQQLVVQVVTGGADMNIRLSRAAVLTLRSEIQLHQSRNQI